MVSSMSQDILSSEFAELYGVSTGASNQAVKRNSNRFSERFIGLLRIARFDYRTI